ncbi:MAG: YihA family ribosome biogenesis GTP-binding protein [Ignavibacteriales bacterium]|nr:YihA family ribosome biogenesis GTP-binding protein [Ignavibacteriales bacterium]
MKISIVDFVVGVANLKQLPKTNLPEIIFIGRSNVGKSSLLNKLCNRKNIARVSATPGKTRELNYYLINKELYFVDLPGYGYAKVAEHVKAGWTQLIEEFFHTRKQIALAIQIVDARLGPTELDNTMMGWLDFYKVPFLLVLTKADKLPKNKLVTQMNTIGAELGKHKFLAGIQPFSAVTGDGRIELLKTIEHNIEEKDVRSSKIVASAVA